MSHNTKVTRMPGHTCPEGLVNVQPAAMRTNRHKPGNMAVLVNAPRPRLAEFNDALEAALLPQLNCESDRS